MTGVDGRRRRIDHRYASPMTQLIPPHLIENRYRASQIDSMAAQPFLMAAFDRGDSRQMKAGVDPLKRKANRHRAGNHATDQLRTGRQIRDASGRKIVQAADSVPISNQ